MLYLKVLTSYNDCVSGNCHWICDSFVRTMDIAIEKCAAHAFLLTLVISLNFSCLSNLVLIIEKVYKEIRIIFILILSLKKKLLMSSHYLKLDVRFY